MPDERPASPLASPAFLALRRSLRGVVARSVHPDHVDDLVQEVLLRMHERAAELRDEACLSAWAHRIARSVVADHHRARPREVELTETREPRDEGGAGEDNDNAVVASWLLPMLAFLPTEYAEAIQLIDVEGMRQKDYAERVGLSLTGAKSRVQRARRMLEGVVRSCCDLEQDRHGNVIGHRSRRGCT